jgi:hypothetical protein
MPSGISFCHALSPLRRSGQSIDAQMVHRLIRMTLSLNIYKDKFEVPFLQESKWYFTKEGNEMISSQTLVSPSSYLLHVENRLNQANEMISTYLHESTRLSLIPLLEETLLAPHLSTLISRGASQMFDQHREDDLKRLYRMCKRIQGLKWLKESWMAYIR